jgi:protein phosphatase/serine/threonine-protein phosphatase Stp1
MSGQLLSQAVTHPGMVRPRNEDSFVDRPDIGLWAVADGAGGHGAGDVASAAVAAALEELPPGLSAAEMLAQLRLRVAAVHADLQRRAQEEGAGRIMATTLVALLARGGHYACLWAGDSRAYLLRDGKLMRLTRDHSLVQELVDQGLLAADQAESHPQANIITRAVGAQGELELDKISARIAPGDLFLLCSDGLFKALEEAEIASLLASGKGPEALLAAALARGARDNVTALAVGLPG